jgi:glycosyltransferase involved in cell wall biosynthesis
MSLRNLDASLRGEALIKGKVSIIIPVYNYGHCVSQAIESALAQTYDNFDVIVIDDGSTDNTWYTLRTYEDHNNERIAIVHRKNVGVSETRNFGIKFSNAEFVLPLDADDWIEPNFLELTVPKMDDLEVGIVAVSYKGFEMLDGVVEAQETTLAQEMKENSIPVCSLIRKEAFNQTPGYTRAFIDTANNRQQLGFEDWNLWIDILKRGWKVAAVKEVLFHYRIKHHESIQWKNSNPGDVGQWCYNVIRKLHPDLYGG